jgi:hypothetical protein
MNFITDLFSGGGPTYPAPCVMGGEELMSEKGHGTSATPVQSNLRWECDGKVADRICNFNRHYAEYRGELDASTSLPITHKPYIYARMLLAEVRRNTMSTSGTLTILCSGPHSSYYTVSSKIRILAIDCVCARS